MPITPSPPDESAPRAAPVISRETEELLLPPRSAVPVPDAEPVFGRGFFRRLRNRPEVYVPLALLGIGLALFLFGVEGTVDKEGLGRNRDPGGFLTAMAFGALFSAVALQALFTGAARKSRRGGSEDDPWTWDHPWRQEWMAPDYTGGGSGALQRPVAFLAVLGVLNLAWVADSWLLKGILLLFDILGLVLLYDVLRKLTQWLRFRHPVVTWRTLPAFLGDRLEGRVSFARSVLPAEPPRVTLRCVRDVWTTRQTNDGQIRELQAFVVYRETWELPQAAPGAPLDYVDFGFDLPDDLPGTKLGTEEPIYWQVQVIVPVAGPDLESIFLAPVYRRTQEAS